MPVSLSVLVDDIVKGKQQAKGDLYLYLNQECYESIKHYLLKKGAQEEDVQDLFQDAVIVLYTAIESNKFNLTSGLLQSATQQFCSYLMGVVKNLWKKELRWRAREPILEDEQLPSSMIEELSAKQLSEVFLQLEESSRQLLRYYFIDKVSPRVIASKTNQNTDIVKKQLYKSINHFLTQVGYILAEKESDHQLEILAYAMGELDERCQNILTKFYYDKMRMREIAEELGYANAQVVTEQKSRCMKRLSAAIANSLINRK